MEDLVESLDNRNLLISLVHKEAKYLKNPKTEIESALEYTLLKYGWTDKEIDFIANTEGNLKVIEQQRTKSLQDLAALRASLREARREELSNIKSLVSSFDMIYTSEHFEVGRSGLQALNTVGERSIARLSLNGFTSRASDSRLKVENVNMQVTPRLNPESKKERELWEKWSGNVPSTRIPSNAEGLYGCHQGSAAGVLVYGKEKPVAWTKLGVSARERAANLKRNLAVSKGSDGAGVDISVSDFLKSLPVFHSADEADIEFLAQHSFLKRCSDSQTICYETDNDIYYIIRSGGVELVKFEATSIDASLLVLEKGAIFPTQGREDDTSEDAVVDICLTSGASNSYQAIGQTDLICVNRSALKAKCALSGNTAISDLLASVVSAKHKKTTDEISLDMHIEQYVAYSIMKKGLTASSSSAGDAIPVFIGKSQRQQRRSILSTALEPCTADAASIGGKQAFRRSSVIDSAIANDGAQGSKKSASSPFESTKSALMLELLNAYSPELDFDDIIQHIVRILKDFFGVDRVGLFLIDREREVLMLKVSQSGAGIEIPLKGIAGFIARTGSLVNLPDVYTDSRFDPSMDMHSGYRTKQMLCLPVYDRPGSVAAVIQFINTFDGRSFNTNDETLATLVSEQIGNLLNVYKSRISRASMKPLHQITDAFRFRLSTVVFQTSHNHLKCQVSIFHGHVPFGQAKILPTVSATSISNEPKSTSIFSFMKNTNNEKQCDFDTWVNFEDQGLCFSHLPLSTRVLLTFSSKNNAPIGWTAFTLFDFERVLRSGFMKLPLYDGECLNPATPLSEGQFSAIGEIESNTVLIELPVFGTKVFYEINRQQASNSTPIKGSTAKSTSELNSDGGSLENLKDRMTTDMRARFDRVLSDPFIEMTESDRSMLWRSRYLLRKSPSLLPKFLLAVNWFDPESVAEAYNLLYTWEPFSYVESLQMLDGRFPDPKVRAAAVQMLGGLTDNELLSFLLQLTQLLKYEQYHDSALSRFLLRRAISSPERIGQTFFWFLRSEMHIKEIRSRNKVLTDIFLKSVGSYRTDLGHQMLVVQRLEEVAAAVKAIHPSLKDERQRFLKEKLSGINFPSSFQLPLSSTIRVSRLVMSKCSLIESGKYSDGALWLTFECTPSDADRRSSIKVPPKLLVTMFKFGDDMRQDQLTSQFLKLMQRLWVEDGLDIPLLTFCCMSTGDRRGFIEIIQNSKTLNVIDSSFNQDDADEGFVEVDPHELWFYTNNVDILNSHRVDDVLFDREGTIRPPRRNALSGPSSRVVLSEFNIGDSVIYQNMYDCEILGVTPQGRYSILFDGNTILVVSADTLRQKDTGSLPYVPLKSESTFSIGINGYDIAKDKFARSLAAYSVAAYMLGISERTGDNIMISKSGELFHIDFGCYFRNLKSRFATKAEKIPGGAIFHPVLAKLLGPEDGIVFATFLNTAAKAFRILRKNASVLLTMLSLMIGCGIPELSSHGDILHVRDNLMLDRTEEEAVEKVKEIFVFGLRASAAKKTK